MIIVQISDIHAAPNNDNLSRLARILMWLDCIDVKVLVITGDLIDDDWTEGYEQIAALLKNKNYAILILPGNSDHPALMRAVIKSPYWHDDVEPLHFAADFDAVRLIGLDTTLPDSAVGSLTEHLPWLEKSLSAEGPATSIVFMHHHIFPSGIPTLDQIMCRDAAKLEACLRTHPRKPVALSSGHVHRPVAGIFSGIPAYICGSVCPANPVWFGSEKVPPVTDSSSFMLHCFTDGTLVSHFINF
ncbi:metallophosphoesterase [Candidatus Pantoea bituminis]|uniref:metallophosphoesterase n=1 Tax=Candidatus Pantoea bituminis TaxID=2831036 RepID=UPI001C0624C9|nr:metallophosphoesterase [Pantoea bituminis]